MEFDRRLESFLELKAKLRHISEEEFQSIAGKAKIYNPWFTEDNIRFAFDGIIKMLHEEKVKIWISKYSFPKNQSSKNIGLIMAGNIPMVGFHDFLCVLISGHDVQAKLSSQDEVLLPFVAAKLVEIDNKWKEKISFVDKLQNFDAVIATGSDNSSRYFEHYFKNYPKIIRKNRTSVAVINGEETEQELKNLGEDIYRYYGLGCRNVSKIYLPQDYDIKMLLDQLNHWIFLADNHKFANNYNYNRAIYSMERIPFLDNGFSIFTESRHLVSPTSVVYYEFYQDVRQLQSLLVPSAEKVQCIVSKNGWYIGSINFGEAQTPEVWDYADNVDTVEFLLGV